MQHEFNLQHFFFIPAQITVICLMSRSVISSSIQFSMGCYVCLKTLICSTFKGIVNEYVSSHKVASFSFRLSFKTVWLKKVYFTPLSTQPLPGE